MNTTAYAVICSLCRHPLSRHGLAADGGFKEGPYVCPCGCGVPQNTPQFGLNERQYNAALSGKMWEQIAKSPVLLAKFADMVAAIAHPAPTPPPISAVVRQLRDQALREHERGSTQ